MTDRPSTSEPDANALEDLASIDLSVAFFCAVLMLFVFVEFNLNAIEAEQPDNSLGQLNPTFSAEPSSWRAAIPSGELALQLKDKLLVLDAAYLATGASNPLKDISSDSAWVSFPRISGFAPNGLHVDINLTSEAANTQIIRASYDITDPMAPCPSKPPHGPLIVYVSEKGEDLSPLLRFGAMCELPLLIEPAPFSSDDDVVRLQLVRSSANFEGESLFR